MAIPIPIIDDRKFQDLMTEAVSLVPRYNKNWTNFNQSDPGIALLEIFAWVTESVIYRTDKITEETYWKYLALIGEHRKKATVFLQEFQPGDLLIAEGEIRLIAEVSSDTSITLLNAFERDFNRSSEIFGLRPEICPSKVLIDGPTIQQVDPEFIAGVTEGDMIIADGKEPGIVQSLEETGGEKIIHMCLPYSMSMSGEKSIGVIHSNVPEEPFDYDPESGGPLNLVRVRGRHILGDGTDFQQELQKGDIIIVGGDSRVVVDIKSKNELIVQVPFYDDIDIAVEFFYVRPEIRTGTVLSDGVHVTGNVEDEDLNAAKLRAITYVSHPYRSVTVSDYEHFSSLAIKQLLTEDEPFRVICFNNRNYEWTAIGTERPGHITIFLLVGLNNSYLEALEKSQSMLDQFDPQVIEEIGLGIDQGLTDGISPGFKEGFKRALALLQDQVQIQLLEKVTRELLKQRIINHVENMLDPKRVLTTRVHVVFPEFKTVMIEAVLILKKGVNEEQAKEKAGNQLQLFLDPISGGPQYTGWPLGRNLHLSEVYQVLEKIEGIDYVYELAIMGADEKPGARRLVELKENEFFHLICNVTIKKV